MPDFKWEDLKDKKVLGGRKGGMPEMVFEYILKQNDLDPQKDLSIDQSIDFGATAAAFTGDDSADFFSYSWFWRCKKYKAHNRNQRQETQQHILCPVFQEQ